MYLNRFVFGGFSGEEGRVSHEQSNPGHTPQEGEKEKSGISSI